MDALRRLRERRTTLMEFWFCPSRGSLCCGNDDGGIDVLDEFPAFTLEPHMLLLLLLLLGRRMLSGLVLCQGGICLICFIRIFDSGRHDKTHFRSSAAALQHLAYST